MSCPGDRSESWVLHCLPMAQAERRYSLLVPVTAAWPASRTGVPSMACPPKAPLLIPRLCQRRWTSRPIRPMCLLRPLLSCLPTGRRRRLRRKRSAWGCKRPMVPQRLPFGGGWSDRAWVGKPLSAGRYIANVIGRCSFRRARIQGLHFSRRPMQLSLREPRFFSTRRITRAPCGICRHEKGNNMRDLKRACVALAVGLCTVSFASGANADRGRGHGGHGGHGHGGHGHHGHWHGGHHHGHFGRGFGFGVYVPSYGYYDDYAEDCYRVYRRGRYRVVCD